MNAFLCQTLLLAVVVAALLALNRRGGTLAAGIATAALSAPTLVLLAGLMSACVCAAAHELGALGSGIVGGLPVVAAWTALGTRWHGGSGAAARYVQAYRRGLWLRAVMTLVFAAAVLPLGALFAMPLALLASGLAATRIGAPGRAPGLPLA